VHNGVTADSIVGRVLRHSVFPRSLSRFTFVFTEHGSAADKKESDR